MKTKTSLILRIMFLVLLTLLTGFALRHGNSSARHYSARGIHADVPRFKPADVARIEISWRKVHSTLVLEKEVWRLKERGNVPASVPKISNLLTTLAEISPVKELTAYSPEILKELHLYDKDPKVMPGVRVILKDRTGKSIFNILLGKGHFVRPEPGMPPSTEAEGRYVLLNGKVYLLPRVFENCHPVPHAWLEPVYFRELQKAITMSVIRYENGKPQICWSVYRKSTAHPFTMFFPKGKTVDNRALSLLAESLSKPFALDLFEGKVDSGKIKTRLNIRCADGFFYTLEIFEGTTKADALRVEVRFEPAAILRIPGETAGQFELRRKQLAERCAFEQKYTTGLYFSAGKDFAGKLNAVPEKTAKKK